MERTFSDKEQNCMQDTAITLAVFLFCFVLFRFVSFCFQLVFNDIYIYILTNSITYSNAESLVADYISIVFAEHFEKCCIDSAVGTHTEHLGGSICKKPAQK